MKKIVLALLITISSANAGQYGMAGCGFGSMIFKDNDKTQILAATTNGTFGSQTFGITFGTLNCDTSGKLASNEKVENFVAVNQKTLETEAARGQGETIQGLATLMGKDYAAVSHALKANYSNIFSKNATSSTVASNIYSYVK
jgi:hypothetical protein